MMSWLRRYFPLLIALAAFVPAAAYFLWALEGGMPARPAKLTSTGFDTLPGWAEDDHAAALATFLRSCTRAEASDKPSPPLQACQGARKAAREGGEGAARAFFETWFVPHHYPAQGEKGFVTGYFEPELKGSRTRDGDYPVPVYRKPDDLVQLTPDVERGAHNGQITAGRRQGEEIVPYPTRGDIENGALEGKGLELLWLADPVEAFFMHVQGSGRVALAGGGHVRIGYAAKNGHPYTAIGRVLIERGEIPRERMSMQSLKAWLRAHPEEGKALMWQNKSYIFFRELSAGESEAGPIGAQGAALTPGRSLAVDGGIHDLGTPVYVSVPSLKLHGGERFDRLMIAQDVGSAIKGPERGDIFWGSGEQAGEIAGHTKHPAKFYILLPRAAAPTS
ncbi:MAG: murein transglycosylase A [Hyphomicrobiales bacterium]